MTKSCHGWPQTVESPECGGGGHIPLCASKTLFENNVVSVFSSLDIFTKTSCVLSFFSLVLGIEPKTLHTLGKFLTPELHLQSVFYF